MQYCVLGADNVSKDISIRTFKSYKAAYNNMRKRYMKIGEVDECEGIIEDAEISNNGASIMFADGDLYYWNIKAIE